MGEGRNVPPLRPRVPGNVRWATREQQNNNKRVNIKYNIDGQLMTLAEIARDIRISYETLHARVNRYGMTIEEAMVHEKNSRHR